MYSLSNILGKLDNSSKFTVVENNDGYIVCHKSQVSMKEALSAIMYDVLLSRGGYNSEMSFEFFDLECNEYGFGITVNGGNLSETNYYILDDAYSNIK